MRSRALDLLLPAGRFPGCLVLLGIVLGSASRAPGAVPAADGLYAVFTVRHGTASPGEFACRLAYDKVPRTVANFAGLAEGSLPFMDFAAGHAVRRPFYDGIVFHRVVAGFVNQAGSPNGQGNDGPGYTFRDEFDSTLRHSRAGILSMANSGLNSNGSQFFVTLAATPWLDDVHSVFGEVVDGMNVVTNIAQGDVITSLRIVRNGAAAQAFVTTGHGLPEVADAGPALESSGDGYRLRYPQTANSEYTVYHSDNLTSWSPLSGVEFHGPAPTSGLRDVTSVTAGKAMKFFEVTRVQYPDPVLTPASVAGRQLRLTDNGGFALAISLTNATAGTYLFTQGATTVGPSPVSAYNWIQEAYRGRFVAAISGLAYGGDPVNQANISLVFSSPTNGTYGGNLSTLGGQTIPLKGTLAVSGL